MRFDPDNQVIRLCAEGMQKEAEALPEEAKRLFLNAWELASNDFEKFTAAHYVARHQPNVIDKLAWDERALKHAMKSDVEGIQASYPSLYLNIAKCHEDLGDLADAQVHYEKALLYSNYLPHDGYGEMIRSGIKNGIERLRNKS